MSQQGPLRDHSGGGGNIMTLSSEGGPPTPPAANNFNFSGSVAGGSAANGAIEFITPGGPGAATDGQMDAVVLTDGTTIHINASNQLEVIGGSFVENFNVDAHTAPGTDPVVPSGLGVVTVTGAQVAAGVVGTNVIRTDSLAANTYTIEIQRSQAVSTSTVADNGVSHFDSANFAVNSSGFVQLTAPVVFSAYLSASQPNVTGDSTQYFIIFDGIMINTGGAYNSVTGVFTAPVTGSYMFTYAVQLFNLNVSHSVFAGGIGDSSSSLTSLFSNSWTNPFVTSTTVTEAGTPIPGLQSYTASGLIPLSVGQQVKISIQVQGGTKTVGVDSHWAVDNRTYFQGFLIR